MANERMQILRKLQAGQINAEEAARLLAALRPAKDLASAGGEAEGVTLQEPAPGPTGTAQPWALAREEHGERWARFWVYPMLVGGALLIVGSLVLGLVYATEAKRGWLVCGWLPLTVGAIVAILAWWTRRAKWLHLRIREKGGHRVAISLPLPLTLAAWVLRIAQPFVPRLKQTGVDDLIIAFRDSPPGEPITIDVQDGDGEHVQIYFG